jgi:hypothetical protein
MRVYHGSYTEIDEIDLSKCEPFKDFGQGFYVTKIREQAEYWANRKGRIAKGKSCVTEYNFIESAFEHWKFHVLRFDSYSEAWLDFVVMNRNPNSPIPAHGYDIVEGPVADDKVTQRLDTYLEGGISKAAFLEELKFFRHTHQICLCTQRSLQALERIHNKKHIGDIDDAILQSLVADYGMTGEEAVDAYFESQTYKKLIGDNAGLYQKSWREIYDILLQELNPDVHRSQ